MIPSKETIRKLHKKYAPNDKAFYDIWTHCCVVADIASTIAQGFDEANKELVSAGALLHDIGVHSFYGPDGLDKKDYITHGLLGYDILKKEGYDEVLCNFSLHHTGAGITKEDVINQKLPMPVADYLPTTLEERIVTYADKFHSKGIGLVFNTPEYYERFLLEKFGESKVKAFQALKAEFGVPDLGPFIAKYKHPVR